MSADTDTVRLATHGQLADAEPVERVEDGDKERFTNVALLTPGEWTDAASGETLFYAPEAIERSLENWTDPRTGDAIEKAQLNHFHDPHAPAENVGHVPVESVHAGPGGAMLGDLVFHRRTQRSEEMADMLALALETGGEEGLGGVSVEIHDDEIALDESRGMARMEEMWFSGVAVVQEPAAATVAFDQQLEGREVALAAAGGDRAVELWRPAARTESHTTGDRPGRGMATDDDTDLQTTLDAVESELASVRRTLADDAEADGGDERGLQDEAALDVAAKVIDRAESEGFDVAQNSAADLLAFAEENMDLSDDERAALSEVADAYLDAADADDLDATPAEGLLDFVREQAGDEPDEEGEEGDAESEPDADDEDEDSEEMAADEAVLGALEEVASTLGDVGERIDAIEGQLSALEEDHGERLSAVEEEPAPRTMAAGGRGVAETVADERGDPAPVLDGVSVNGEFISRG